MNQLVMQVKAKVGESMRKSFFFSQYRQYRQVSDLVQLSWPQSIDSDGSACPAAVPDPTHTLKTCIRWFVRCASSFT